MHTTDRTTILDNLEQLRRELDAGTYMEWREPLPRGRKGMDHSGQRIINVHVAGEPRDSATLPASVSLERDTIGINIEALKRFVTGTQYGIEWREESSASPRLVSITIRSPQTYEHRVGTDEGSDEQARKTVECDAVDSWPPRNG